MLIFWERNWDIYLLSFGWGLVLDEIIPWLKMPTVGRNIELDVYRNTRNPSLILVCTISVLLILLNLLINNR